jgi:hypothetical protein
MTDEKSLIETACYNWKVDTDKGYVRWLTKRPVATYDGVSGETDVVFPDWAKDVKTYALVVLEVDVLERIQGDPVEIKEQFGAYLSAEELLFKTKITHMYVLEVGENDVDHEVVTCEDVDDDKDEGDLHLSEVVGELA